MGGRRRVWVGGGECGWEEESVGVRRYSSGQIKHYNLATMLNDLKRLSTTIQQTKPISAPKKC